MKEKFLKTIAKYSMLAPGDSVLIAVSGGKDSVALLHLLNEIKEEFELKLTAVHINHSIRGKEALRDEAFVGNLCEKLGVDFECETFDVPEIAAERGLSLEECGRELRYKAFDSFGCDKIATAHTLSDSTETMLFNLARGSGVKGLCGIPPVRGNIIRPLIECTSEDVFEYLRESGFEFVSDSTNESKEYARNLIRLSIIPELKKINPAFEKNISNTISILKEQSDFLKKSALEQKKIAGTDAGKLLSLEDALRHEVIRLICAEKIAVVPEYKHILAIDECLKTGSQVQINSGAIVRVRSGKLEFVNKEYDSEYFFQITPGEFKLPIGTLKAEVINCEQFENLKSERFYFILDYDKITHNLFCRNKKEGDRFYDGKRKLSKSLKKYLNEIALEPEKRSAFPVFTMGGEVIGTLGSNASEELAPDKNSKRIFFIHLCEE